MYDETPQQNIMKHYLISQLFNLRVFIIEQQSVFF